MAHDHVSHVGDFEVWSITEKVFDSLFLIDIVLCFISAFYDEDFVLIDSHKIIAYNYIRSWFAIDVVAIFPFWAFEGGEQDNMNGVVRIARIGRMWKIMKLTRLIRLVKLVKKKNLAH